MSFADGFTKGFGLIQDAKNSAREAELRQQQLDDANRYRMDSLQMEREQNAFTRGIQQKELDELIRQGKVADEQAALDAEERRKRDEREAKRQADLREIKQSELDANEAVRSAAEAKEQVTLNQIKQAKAAEALDVFMRDLQRVERGEISWNEIDTSTVVGLTEGTTFDMANMLDPSTFSTGAELFKAINSGQLPSEDIVLRAMNQFIAGTGVGEVIDETYQNAPEWMQDGQYKVVGKKFVSLDTGTDFVRDANGEVVVGEDGKEQTKNVLFGNVRMTVEGPGGELFYYTAPATDYRNQKGSKHTAIDINELTQAYAGFMNMANFVRRKGSAIEAALIKDKYPDSGAFDARKAEIDKKYRDLAADPTTANESSFITGMTNAELFNNKPLLEKVIKQEALFEGSRRNREDLGYERTINTVRSAEEVQQIEAQLRTFGMPPLNNNQLEELVGYFDVTPDGRLVADNAALRKFRNKIGIRGKQLEEGAKTYNPGR